MKKDRNTESMVNSTFAPPGSSTVSVDSPVPLYIQVADSLRNRIASGVWQKGQLIPSLELLAEEFRVARVTARQAVQRLSEEQLLVSRRGIGTVVARSIHPPRFVNLQTSLADLAAMYESTEVEILTFNEGLREPRVGQGEGKLGAAYVHMDRLHFADGQPYAVVSLDLLDSVFRKDPEGFRKRAIVALLVRMKVVERARQTMSIAAADAQVATLLRVSAGTPVARVSRVFHTKNNVVLYSAEVIYRGDWVRWEIDLIGPPARPDRSRRKRS